MSNKESRKERRQRIRQHNIDVHGYDGVDPQCCEKCCEHSIWAIYKLYCGPCRACKKVVTACAADAKVQPIDGVLDGDQPPQQVMIRGGRRRRTRKRKRKSKRKKTRRKKRRKKTRRKRKRKRKRRRSRRR